MIRDNLSCNHRGSTRQTFSNIFLIIEGDYDSKSPPRIAKITGQSEVMEEVYLMGSTSGLNGELSVERRLHENDRSDRSTTNQENNPRIPVEALHERYYSDDERSR